MRIEMIVAVDENNVIGKNNTLPWHLRDDLKHFKSVTLGNTLLMGRNTYESLGKPLQGRMNIVVTSNPSSIKGKYDNLFVVRTIEDAMITAQELGDRLIVIGGGVIYEKILPYTDKLWLTRVHTKVEGGDTFFPINYKDHLTLDWYVCKFKDECNEHDYTLEVYKRRQNND